MSRLVDADEIPFAETTLVHTGEKIVWIGKHSIDAMPTVDAVSVVRCKDCVYFNAKNSLETQGICMCGEKEMNYGGEFYPFADDFCSYGERKKE